MRKYKLISPSAAAHVGSLMRAARISRGLRIVDAAIECAVDVSQISRIERGAFKTLSQNLQKYLRYLQIDVTTIDETLVERFKALIERSPAHRQAGELIVKALDQLCASPIPAASTASTPSLTSRR